MKLPRDVSSAALQTSLRRLGYEATRDIARGHTRELLDCERSPWPLHPTGWASRRQTRPAQGPVLGRCNVYKFYLAVLLFFLRVDFNEILRNPNRELVLMLNGRRHAISLAT